MKAVCLFIFTTTFSQTMTKQFLITLDKDKGKESQKKSNIIEQDDEKVNNAKDLDEKDLDTKGEENKKPNHATADQNKTGNDNSFANDNSSHLMKTAGKNTVGQDYSGGGTYYSAQQLARQYRGGGGGPKPYKANWECRYKRSGRLTNTIIFKLEV